MSNIGGLEYLPKSNRSCFVYGCFSTAAIKPHLGFHKFPAKKKRNIVVIKKNGDKCIYDRRQVWIEALNIGREASLAIDGVNVYVCSLHFSRDDFYYNQDITGKRYLKENAIPRRNLPPRSTSSLTTKFSVKSLNRIKYRGYFNIHNPDGRKLTAPRRFLGTTKYKDTTVGQSYTKTVWVVRKPNLIKDPAEQDCSRKNGLDKFTVPNSFSLEDNSQDEEYGREETEDEQCTILGTDNTQQNNNPWFTSELIIKEEPLSDSDDQDSELLSQKELETDYKDSELLSQKELETDYKVSGETSNNEDEEDNNYDSNKLVIETEEDEVKNLAERGVELPEVENMGEFQQTKVEEFEPAEKVEEDFSNIEEFEATEFGQFSLTEDEIIELSENTKELNGTSNENSYKQDYDVTVVNVNEEDYESQSGSLEGEPCHLCGKEDCQGHSNHPRPRENYFVCLVCSDIFPSQKQLAIHSISHQEVSDEELQMFEERTKSLTCEFCGRVLSTKATLREHIMIHTGEKPHECMLCGKSFRHKANLVVHVNGHAVVSTYKCKKCNKAFTKKIDFENHLRFHVDASGNPLVCKICNAVFKSQRTLYNHAQLHTRKGMVRVKKRSNGPRVPVHVCKTCGKVLSTKATLKEHMMIHSGEKPHVCTICGRTIRHKANFVVHIQTHGQGKSYECDMCDEAFMRKSDLTQHKQISHSRSKLLRCPICSEVFKSPQKFNRHMEIHESVVYMNETEELTGFQPHLLEGLLDTP